MIIKCTQSEWIYENEPNYNWYYNNYPLYASGIILPVSFETLQAFYVLDMNDRNLQPQANWLRCYEALFSYLLGRVTGQIDFQGDNWFQRFIKNIPVAIDKTIDDIIETAKNPFGISWPLIFGVLVAGIVLVKVK